MNKLMENDKGEWTHGQEGSILHKDFTEDPECMS